LGSRGTWATLMDYVASVNCVRLSPLYAMTDCDELEMDFPSPLDVPLSAEQT